MTRPFVVVAMAGGLALSLAACRNTDVAEPEASSGDKVTVRLLKEPTAIRSSPSPISTARPSPRPIAGQGRAGELLATWCRRAAPKFRTSSASGQVPA